MLQKISDRIQGWVAGCVIVIIAFVFVLWGIEYYLVQRPNGSKALAKVDGKVITQNQFNSLYHQLSLRFNFGVLDSTLRAHMQEQLKDYVLQQLIDETSLLTAAQKVGFRVSDQDGQRLIMQVPQFQSAGQFDPQKFQQFLYKIKTPELQFLQQIKDNFIISQVMLGIKESAFILPNEVKRAYALIHQKRDFGYFVLPLSKFRSEIRITEKEITSYYQQHKENYRKSEQVKISYLQMSAGDIEKEVMISPVQVREYYDQNKASYLTPKKWKFVHVFIPLKPTASSERLAAVKGQIEEIKMKLVQGQSISSKNSIPGVKVSTITLAEEQLGPEILSVIEKMKPHQVSDSFRSKGGFNVVKLIAVLPSKIKPYSEVEGQVRELLQGQEVEKILSQKTEQLTNLTYTNPDTLDIAAQQLNLTIQKSDWFTKKGEKTGVLSNPAVVNSAFGSDVLKDSNNSRPIPLKNGGVLVLRVIAHQPSEIKPLSDVVDEVRQVLLKNKLELRAGLQAYKISSALESLKMTPEGISKKYGVQWILKSKVTFDDKTVPALILNTAFSTLPMNSGMSSGVNTLTLDNGDYVVLKVFSYQLGNLGKSSAKQIDTLKKELAAIKAEQDYQLYQKSVLDHGNIKILFDHKKGLSSGFTANS